MVVLKSLFADPLHCLVAQNIPALRADDDAWHREREISSNGKRDISAVWHEGGVPRSRVKTYVHGIVPKWALETAELCGLWSEV